MRFIAPLLRFSVVVPALLLWGCIGEDYSGCPQYVAFDLSYVHNKDNRDKFSEQVNSMTLFIYDSTGKLVRQVECAATPEIGSESLSKGKYHAVFWGNYMSDNFTIDGPAHLADHTLTLLSNPGGEVRDFDGTLFHYSTDFQIQEWGTTRVAVPLVKNTNKITIRLAGSEANPLSDDYRVTISGSNAVYKSDNSLAAAQPDILYYPTSEVRNADDMCFCLTVMRLFFGDNLQVDICKGATSCKRVPLVATLAEHAPHLLTDSDLDRYDEYELTFTLASDDTFVLTAIRINDWTKVIQNGGIG